MKKQNGITLISLIITIIVMVILAGIALSFSVGENGVITKAEETKTIQSNAEELEKVSLVIANAKTSNLSSLNGDPEFDETLIKQAIEKEFGTGSCEVEKESDYFVVTIKATNNKYKITLDGKVEKLEGNGVPPTEDGEDEEVVDALEEYYLNLLNKAYESIEATEEEVNLAQDELIELENVLFWTDTGIWCMVENYYYKASEDDFLFSIVNKESDEYKKYFDIANEVLDLLTDLNTLFKGYSYRGDMDYKEEFRVKIENELGKNVEVKSKGADDIYLIFQSVIDEKYELEYSVYVRGEYEEYKVREIENSYCIGF